MTDPSIMDKPPSQWRRLLAFQNISAIYIFIVIFIIFAIWTPSTFLKPQTWANLLDTNSLLVMAGIAVLIPLVTGVFNLAVGADSSARWRCGSSSSSGQKTSAIWR